LIALCSTFFFLILLPPVPTLFPYTTLFRSFDPGLGHRREPGPACRAALPRRPLRPPLVGPRLAQGWPRRRRHLPPSAHRQAQGRSEEHTSELQSRENLVCRLLLEKKKNNHK